MRCRQRVVDNTSASGRNLASSRCGFAWHVDSIERSESLSTRFRPMTTIGASRQPLGYASSSKHSDTRRSPRETWPPCERSMLHPKRESLTVTRRAGTKRTTRWLSISAIVDPHLKERFEHDLMFGPEHELVDGQIQPRPDGSQSLVVTHARSTGGRLEPGPSRARRLRADVQARHLRSDDVALVIALQCFLAGKASR
jgi:hypothetical protein